MAYEDITALDLEVNAENMSKTCANLAYEEKAQRLHDRLHKSGLYDSEWRDSLSEAGIEEVSKHPSDYELDEMNAKVALALLSAIVDMGGEVGLPIRGYIASGLVECIQGRLERIDYDNRPLPQWIENAAEQILSDLQDFPSDAETTPGRLIQPYLEYIGKDGRKHMRGLSFNDEFDIVTALERKAKDFGLFLDSAAYDYATIGLPINIPFRVRRVPIGCDGPDNLFALQAGAWRPRWSSLQIRGFLDGVDVVRLDATGDCENVIFPIDDGQLQRLDALLSRTNASDWDSFINADVLDGVSWSLSFKDEAGQHESSGSNAFPDGFDELVAFLVGEFGFDAHVFE